MASVITDLAAGAAKTAHAHVAALLAARQVKPGDKLPLKETVKETDAGKAFSLAPTGKNIFVRVPHYTVHHCGLWPGSSFCFAIPDRSITLLHSTYLTPFLTILSQHPCPRPTPKKIFLSTKKTNSHNHRLACLGPSRPRAARRHRDISTSTTSSRQRASTRSTSSP
jgi:hypothetical protein